MVQPVKVEERVEKSVLLPGGQAGGEGGKRVASTTVRL